MACGLKHMCSVLQETIKPLSKVEWFSIPISGVEDL